MKTCKLLNAFVVLALILGGLPLQHADADDSFPGSDAVSTNPPALVEETASLATILHIGPPVGENYGEVSNFDASLLNYLRVVICQVNADDSCVAVKEFTAQPDSDKSNDLSLLKNIYYASWKPTKNQVGYEYLITLSITGLEEKLDEAGWLIEFTPTSTREVPIKFRIDNHPVTRARVLHEQGLSMSEIAPVIQDEFNLSASTLARVLYDEFHGDFVEEELKLEIAIALRAAGFTASEAYDALKDVFNIIEPTMEEINVLEEMLIDAGYTEEEVFNAIQTELLAIYNILIQQYAPVVYLHPAEKYFMSSVDWFMERTALVAGRTMNSDPIEIDIVWNSQVGEVAPSELADLVAEKREEYGDDLEFWFTDGGEDPCQSLSNIGSRAGNMASAESYVHAERGKEYTDLQFWFFYPYNGPGTTQIDIDLQIIANSWQYHDGRAQAWTPAGDYGNACPMGVHTGDWETVMLRFDTNGELLGAFMSAHGEYTYYPKEQLEIENGHVVAYSSLNGHANYPTAGDNALLAKEIDFPAPGSSISDIPILHDTEVDVDIHTLNWASKGGAKFEAATAYQIIAIDKTLLDPPIQPPAPEVSIAPLASALQIQGPLGKISGDPTTFDASLLDYLKVTVCETTSGGDCTVIQEFTAQPESKKFDTIKLLRNIYHVNWDTSTKNVGKTYEIRVSVADMVIGSTTLTPDTSRTVPIKFYIYNHPLIRYQVLESQGKTTADILDVLNSEFSLSHVDMAWILQMRGFPVDAAAAMLRDLGYNPQETYQAVKVIFGLNATDAVAVLVNAGYTERQAWYAVSLEQIVDSSWMRYDGRWGWFYSFNLTDSDKVDLLENLFGDGLDHLYRDGPEICSVLSASVCGLACTFCFICNIFCPACYPICFGACFSVLNAACTGGILLMFDYIVEQVAPMIVDEIGQDDSGGPDSPMDKDSIYSYFLYPNESKIIKVKFPEQNNLVTDNVTIEVEVASGLTNVSMVELGINDIFYDITDTQAPGSEFNLFTYTWETNTYQDGFYTLHARVLDTDGKSIEYFGDTTDVIIANNSVFVDALTLSPDAINEGETVTISGEFHSPSVAAHTAVVDWGDGLQDVVNIPAGERDFSTSHQYLDDNPSGTLSDIAVIHVQVDSAEGKTGGTSATLDIKNTAPEAGTISANTDLIALGEADTFSASFNDQGMLDTHSVIWDWGDGNTNDINNAMSPVETSHTYQNPGIYEVNIAVTDDDGASTDFPTYNVAVYEPVPVSAHGAGEITALVQDPECTPDPCIDDQNQCKIQTEGQFYFVYSENHFELVYILQNMVFHSTNADIVDLTATTLYLEGTGEINGENAPNGEPYGFSITVGDGTPDTYQIKIWFDTGQEIAISYGMDISNGDTVLTIINSTSVHSAVYNPDGTKVVTADEEGMVKTWDLSSDSPCVTVLCTPLLVIDGHTAPVNFAEFSPDGQHIISASDDGTARIWDAGSGEQILILEDHKGAVNSATYSLDGLQIVTASDDKTARVWDASNGEQLRKLNGHTDVVNSAAYSPDGLRIVTASDDGTARVWDASTGDELLRLENLTGAVHTAAYSPDGLHIVTANEDGTARVWDAGTGDELLQLSGHTDTVNSAAYSPDGLQIVTAGADAIIRIWNADTGELISEWSTLEPVTRASWSVDGDYVLTAHPAREQRGSIETDLDQTILNGQIEISE